MIHTIWGHTEMTNQEIDMATCKILQISGIIYSKKHHMLLTVEETKK